MPAPFACTPSMFHSEECAVLKVGVVYFESFRIIYSSSVMLCSSLPTRSPTPTETDGGWRILHRLRRLRVAYPLRFCFVRAVCVPDDSAGQRWAVLCFAFTSRRR